MRSPELNEFSQALIAALRSMRKANEIPVYLNTKAREVNAGFAADTLDDKLEGGGLKEFLLAPKKLKICSDETLKTKEEIMREIAEVKPFIDRFKEGGFKLMLDRYMAAHKLAIKLAELVPELEKKYNAELAQEKIRQ